MPIKLNGATNGSVELDVPAAVGSDLQVTLPATAGTAIVKATDGSVDLGSVDIDSSGRLLVGTSSGSGNAKLQVQGGTQFGDAYIDLCFSGTVQTNQTLGELRFTDAASSANVYANIACQADGAPGSNDYPGRLIFRTTADGASIPTERMRITSGGEMLFRCTGITGDAPNATGARVYQNNGNCKVRGTSTTSSGTDTAFQFYHGTQTSAFQGKITVDNSSVSYHTSSDYRLKENVVDIADGITRIKQLAPKRFNFIVDAEKTVDGFLAHEAQTVVPEAVSGEKDATREEEYEVTPAVLNDDGEQVTPAVMGTRTVPDHQGIDQSKLVPLLTAALQEAISKIETLETKVAALEATP